MNRKLAHGLRRTARTLMRWSNKLEPVKADYSITIASTNNMRQQINTAFDRA